MEGRLRIVCFCMNQRGHWQRIRAVVAALVQSGAEVCVVTARQFEAEVTATGAAFCDLFRVDPLTKVDGTSVPPPFRYVTFAWRLPEAVMERVRSFAPNLVVYDSFAVAGRVVAERLGLPFVNVCAGHAVHPGVLPSLVGDLPRSSPSDECSRALGELAEELDVEATEPFGLLCAPSPHLNIVCEPPQFLDEGERRALEPVAFFGSLSPRPLTAPAPSVFPDGQGQRVYVCLGTVNYRYYPREVAAALAVLVDELERARVRAVVSLAGHSSSDLPTVRWGAHVRVCEYADQWRALEEADAFITHHGLNSTHEALYHRVPMLSYPLLWDQPAMALRCRNLGLALPLVETPRAPLDTARLHSALEDLASSGAEHRARREEARNWELAVMAERAAVVRRAFQIAETGTLH